MLAATVPCKVGASLAQESAAKGGREAEIEGERAWMRAQGPQDAKMKKIPVPLAYLYVGYARTIMHVVGEGCNVRIVLSSGPVSERRNWPFHSHLRRAEMARPAPSSLHHNLR